MAQVARKGDVALGQLLAGEHHHDGGERLVVIDRLHARVGAVGGGGVDLLLDGLVGVGGKVGVVVAREVHDIRAVVVGLDVGAAKRAQEVLAGRLADTQDLEEVDGDGDRAGSLQRGGALGGRLAGLLALGLPGLPLLGPASLGVSGGVGGGHVALGGLLRLGRRGGGLAGARRALASGERHGGQTSRKSNRHNHRERSSSHHRVPSPSRAVT